jgi:quercetin dioxygenase-like cupin family protein
MPVVKLEDVPRESFRGGATYQTIVGDQAGSTPIRVGIQTSPPGYKTPLHSHPYMETVTVREGEGEAWLDDQSEVVELRAGTTLVFPANLRHWFGATGDKPMIHFGRARVARADRRHPRRLKIFVSASTRGRQFDFQRCLLTGFPLSAFKARVRLQLGTHQAVNMR